MADKRITLFEFHLHDGEIQIGPASIGDAVDEEEAIDQEETDGETVEEAGGPPIGRVLKLLAVLFVLAVLVGAAVKLLGENPATPLAELDEELDGS